MARHKNRSEAAKQAADTRQTREALAEVAPDRPTDGLPDGVTMVRSLDGHTTIENLMVVPPLRASGASEGAAREAFAYQMELRERQDAFDRGPVVATGVKAALPPPEPSQEGDLNPGQDAPDDNPV